MRFQKEGCDYFYLVCFVLTMRKLTSGSQYKTLITKKEIICNKQRVNYIADII